MLRQSIALSCFLTATGVAAEPVSLSSEALKESVTGSKIELDTPLGTKIPIHFSEDGMLSGEAGDLASVLGAPKDRGRWWIANDRLCYKWFRWFDAESHCLNIRQDGSRILWRQDDGKTGTATITMRSPPSVSPKSETVAVNVEKPAAEPAAADAAPPIMYAGMAPSLFSAPAKLANASPPPAADAVPAPVPDAAEEADVKAPSEAKSAVPVNAAAVPPSGGAKPKKIAAVKSSSVATVVSFRVEGVQQDDVLNVRSAPSSEAAAIGTIPPGGRGLRITGACIDDWCPIKHRKVSGWVNRIYLAEEHEPQPAATARGRGRNERH